MSESIDTVAIPGYLAGTWTADPIHSEVGFAVRHLVSKTRGKFTGFEATITTGENPLESSVSATIDMASIETGFEARDTHLRSAEYFDVENHPKMTYRSTGVQLAVDEWLIDGELTLHGVTRPVPLVMTVNGFGPDPFGGYRAGFSATAQLSRREFGIDLTVPLDGGGVVVGDKVWITLEIEAVRQT
jgi:polyisoprenoid-binding protein YceI